MKHLAPFVRFKIKKKHAEPLFSFRKKKKYILHVQKIKDYFANKLFKNPSIVANCRQIMAKKSKRD